MGGRGPEPVQLQEGPCFRLHNVGVVRGGVVLDVGHGPVRLEQLHDKPGHLSTVLRSVPGVRGRHRHVAMLDGAAREDGAPELRQEAD
jgi:hypothetical protein